MVDASFVKIGDWKAEFVVVPDQVAVFDGEPAKGGRVEVGLNQGIARPAQERREIDRAVCGIAEGDAESQVSRMPGSFDKDHGVFGNGHLILRVIVSARPLSHPARLADARAMPSKSKLEMLGPHYRRKNRMS